VVLGTLDGHLRQVRGAELRRYSSTCRKRSKASSDMLRPQVDIMRGLLRQSEVAVRGPAGLGQDICSRGSHCEEDKQVEKKQFEDM
jgi:hypothetical protein